MGRLLRNLLIVLLVLVAAYAGVSWIFSNKLIAPTFTPLGPVDLAAKGLPQPESAQISGDGVTLAAWYFANPRKAGCAVVMLHGFGGGKEEVVGATPIFWDRGCDLLLYDSRGHGESSPALLSFGFHERKDAAFAIDWLAKRSGLPRTKIGLIGWSYGASTAIQVAADVPDVAFVVADSSFSSLGDIARAQADKQFGSWAKLFVPGALFVSSVRAGFDARDSAPDKAIRDVKAPVLLIHSRQDGFTPYQHSEEIYANSHQDRTRLVIPAWEATHAHSYTENPAGYTAVVAGFLRTFVPGFGT